MMSSRPDPADLANLWRLFNEWENSRVFEMMVHIDASQAKEYGVPASVKGYSVRINGRSVMFGEHWRDKDETWGDGIDISIPMQVWAKMLPFIVEHTKDNALMIANAPEEDI